MLLQKQLKPLHMIHRLKSYYVVSSCLTHSCVYVGVSCLTPGCIYVVSSRLTPRCIYVVSSCLTLSMLREINKTTCSICKLVLLLELAL
jgi:hypothetical protein